MKKRTSIEGDVANIVLRIVLDGEKFEPPTLPPVVGGTWGDLSLENLWGPLSYDGPELIWEVQSVHGAPADTDAKLRRIDGLWNAPALLHLADGTRVHAAFGNWRRWGGRSDMAPGYTCAFNVWRVEGKPSARWIGRIHGGGFLNANLKVAGPTRSTAANMRLEGRYTWYILDERKEDEPAIVLIDAGPSPLDHEALHTDFNALQVVFGRPMQLDTLVALDAPGNVVGCAGVHLGGNRKTERRGRADGPVPDAFADECWIPVLFNRLTSAMVDSDLPWGMLCSAFLDSVSDSTIDSRYLKLHVALEAFAKALLKSEEARKGAPRTLVRDKDAWVAWVKKQHGDELRAMVEQPSLSEVFIGKVISAMNLPSSSVVADALGRLDPPLVVDDAVLDELEKRNVPAHNFSMNKPGVDYDVDRDVARIDMLRSLLIALMARACGYDGAIAGWVTGKAGGWKPQPDWWPPPPEGVTEEARRAFVCERRPRPSIRPHVFRSRLRTKSK